MLPCKCSEIRSHDSDRSPRNQHNCFQCFHPFKSGYLVTTNLITDYPEVKLPQIQHFMGDSNPHRHYEYKQ